MAVDIQWVNEGCGVEEAVTDDQICSARNEARIRT